MGLKKQVLSTQHTLVRIMAPISRSVAIYYLKSISFIEFLMDVCIYDDIVDIIHTKLKKLLYFKLSKSGEILHVDKTGFPRLSQFLYACIHA